MIEKNEDEMNKPASTLNVTGLAKIVDPSTSGHVRTNAVVTRMHEKIMRPNVESMSLLKFWIGRPHHQLVGGGGGVGAGGGGGDGVGSGWPRMQRGKVENAICRLIKSVRA
jgi:hypothetical protein